jgi:ATP-dependent Clp protease ATP-binding subunit ClpX
MPDKGSGSGKGKQRSKGGAGRGRTAYCSFCRKSYRDVGPLVEGPGDVYICGECVELCQSILTQEKRRRSHPQGLPPHASSPEDIRVNLDRYVVGQPEAKAALALAAHRHHETLGHGPQGHGAAAGGPGGILLVGPTRSSKVVLARALAHILDVPFAHGDGSTLANTDPGAPGGEPLLYKLLLAGDFDLGAAGRGVVYVDGVDHRGVQQDLLKVMDGRMSNALPHGLHMDTADILFLCGGRFEGLDEVIARRGRHPEQPVDGEDLLAFGMIPDLVRRLQAVVRLAPLDDETLVRLASWVDLKGLSGGVV